MIKQRNYDISLTNVALIGSELDKKCREAAAAGEPAWATAGKKAGIEVWRIEKFHVKPVPVGQYGSFFDGDSYIVLKTTQVADKLHHDIHFWLGDQTTQDEAGTAAYKTVELDDFFGGAPTQHREIQGFESQQFLSYWNLFKVLHGGIESGFTHVIDASYKPRLLHIKGKKHIQVIEAPLNASSLNAGDVFILDLGLTLYQWTGKQAGIMEKNKGGQIARALDDERGGKAEVIVITQGEEPDAFWAPLGGKQPIHEAISDEAPRHTKALYRVSDADGQLKIQPVTPVSRAALHSDDVFVLDAGFEVFAWIGQKSSASEKKNGLAVAQNFLISQGRPLTISITKVLEGAENEAFFANF